MQPAPEPTGPVPVFGAEANTPAAPPAPVPPWTGAPVPGAAPGWEHVYAQGRALSAPPVGSPVEPARRAGGMTARQLAQEISNAAFDRRHDDVQRFLARLVVMAEAASGPASIEPSD